MTTDLHGGVVFRIEGVLPPEGALHFLPVSVAMKVLPVPEIAPMPGAPALLRGVALVDGAMVPVVDVRQSERELDADGMPKERALRAKPCGAMLVCAVLGERVGLVGLDVVATGRWERGEATGLVKVGAETARLFDVADVVARVREGRWAV